MVLGHFGEIGSYTGLMTHIVDMLLVYLNKVYALAACMKILKRIHIAGMTFPNAQFLLPKAHDSFPKISFAFSTWH